MKKKTYIITLILCMAFISWMIKPVDAASTPADAKITIEPAGWEVDANWSGYTPQGNSTGGFTIMKQTTGGSTKKSSGGSSSGGSTSDTASVLKIPDKVKINVEYSFEDSAGKKKTVKKSYEKDVTELADNLFYENDTLDEVVIPSTCIKVGNYAFYNCRNLKKVTIPSSVQELGEGAFEYCSGLTSVTIPSMITEIKRHAFFKCTALSELEFMLPSTVQTIGPSAFSGCSALTSVTIPTSVQNITDDAFENCSSLSEVIILSGGSNVSIGKGSFEGCTSLTSITLPSSVISIGSYAFWKCSSLAHVDIPDNMSYANISSNAFDKCSPNLELTSGKTSEVGTYAAKHNIRFKYRTGGIASLFLKKASLVWSGNPRKATVQSVRDADGKLLTKNDYTVTYTNNKKVGTATVTVTATDASHYTGSASATFSIIPRKPSVNKISTGRKKATISWSKREEAGGYQIKYSRFKSFKNSSTTTRTLKIKKNTNISTTLSLESGKKYYVKVRAYKSVGGVKYYSKWSAVKTFKTR